MIHEQINLTDDGRVNVRTYVVDEYRRTEGVKRPAVIVFPGGGYEHISTSEGEPVALTFNQLGYNAFVLTYSVGDYSEWPNPMMEVARTLKMVREHADEWQIDTDKIAVCGFSAGGSLSAIASTQWHAPEFAEALNTTAEMLKVNAAVVCYGPADLAYMEDFDEEKLAELAAINVTGIGKIMVDRTPQLGVVDFIDEQTSPTFIMIAREDEAVDPRNALSHASKLYEVGVPFELHLFDDGHHGMSVNNRISHPLDDDVSWAFQQWVPLADHFLRRTFGMNE